MVLKRFQLRHPWEKCYLPCIAHNEMENGYVKCCYTVVQEGSLVLKCFQLLADALNQIQSLEQVLVPNFHTQIEAMLKSMAESKVGLSLYCTT